MRERIKVENIRVEKERDAGKRKDEREESKKKKNCPGLDTHQGSPDGLVQ